MLASASLSSLRAAAAAPLRVQAASMTLRRWLSAYGKGQPVAMPALSPTMTSGKIARWTVKEGDKLTAGQAIAEIETDKVCTSAGERWRGQSRYKFLSAAHGSPLALPTQQATMDFQFQDDDMIMAKILVPAGSDIAVGTTVALVVDNAADLAEVMGGTYAAGAAAAPAPAAAKPAAAPAPARAASVGSAALAPAPASAAGGRLTSSPYARKLAAAAGIHLAAIGAGSGPNGRIVASDVQGYKAPAAATVAAAAPASVSSIEGLSARSGYTDVPQSSIRRVIAHRLTQSKQTVPHYYLTSELCLDALVVMRSQLNADLPAEAKLSVNDFLIKASALACKKVPEVNSAWLGDVIRAYDYVDVAVAVAIPDGLITPIVKDANAKGLTAISKCVPTASSPLRSPH